MTAIEHMVANGSLSIDEQPESYTRAKGTKNALKELPPAPETKPDFGFGPAEEKKKR